MKQFAEVGAVGRKVWEAETKSGSKFGVSAALEGSWLVVGGLYRHLGYKI